jgi:hypothetical protein
LKCVAAAVLAEKYGLAANRFFLMAIMLLKNKQHRQFFFKEQDWKLKAMITKTLK